MCSVTSLLIGSWMKNHLKKHALVGDIDSAMSKVNRHNV